VGYSPKYPVGNLPPYVRKKGEEHGHVGYWFQKSLLKSLRLKSLMKGGSIMLMGMHVVTWISAYALQLSSSEDPSNRIQIQGWAKKMTKHIKCDYRVTPVNFRLKF